ncbi:MAG: phosphohistidine phosphatase SixA [bacterium]|nr:phosphohistidine phosphatase SixA [bacterium]
MKVYFLRHGLAGKRSEWKRDDAERPLTVEGIERMHRIAATLAALDLGLDAIVTSPLVRAKQTAEIVAQELEMPLKEDARLAPGFNAELLRGVLLDHPGAKSVMVVGHEPDFSATIGALVGGGSIICRKGGLALVELPDAHSHKGELLWLVPPRILASGES